MRKLTPLLFLLAAIGCITNRPLGQSQLAQIKKGETTQGQVREILGPPRSATMLDGPYGVQNIWTYSASYATPTKANMWNGVLLGAQYMNYDIQVVSIGFDSKGIVNSVSISQGGLPPPENLTGKNRTDSIATPGQKGGH